MTGLKLEDVSIAYGDTTVVTGADLHVEDGEMVAIIGANGAGKTSLLRAISGLAAIKSGTVSFGHNNLLATSAWDIVSLGLVHVPEGRRLFKQMTVEENLFVGGYSRNPTENKDELSCVYELPKIERAADAVDRNHVRRRAADGRHRAWPKLLMLDEPSLGLAPKIPTALAN